MNLNKYKPEANFEKSELSKIIGKIRSIPDVETSEDFKKKLFLKIENINPITATENKSIASDTNQTTRASFSTRLNNTIYRLFAPFRYKPVVSTIILVVLSLVIGYLVIKPGEYKLDSEYLTLLDNRLHHEHEWVKEDRDNDGNFDLLKEDVNKDNKFDLFEYDDNKDGIYELLLIDLNYDNVIDVRALDTNHDGLFDNFSLDTDYDGIFDITGIDTDYDELPDVFRKY